MSLWHKLRWKLAVTAVLAIIIWFGGEVVGFPPIFRLFFIGYVLIALPFFILLDTRFGTRARLGAWTIPIVFVVASVVLILVGRTLPQYDPQVEQDKIARTQRSFLERQKPERLQTLQKEAAELGMVVVEPGQVSQTAAQGTPVPGATPAAEATPVEGAEATPPPELVKRGEQAYNDWECYNCHKVGGKGGVKRRGPELDNTGNLLSPDALWAKILDPRVFLSEGFAEEYDKVTMPDDFGKRLSDDEIKALVAYLSTLKDSSVQTPKPLFPGTPKDGQAFYEIPIQYQKRMPPGWWTDPKIVEEGKAIYEGQVHSDVVCSACHGRDGTPVLSGAADFRNLDLIEGWSEFFWYWRIATGVKDTAMTGWESKLTPEEIFKVMAYENTFGYGGAPTDHAEKFYPPKAQK